MKQSLRRDCETVIQASLLSVQPNQLLPPFLQEFQQTLGRKGHIYLVSIGKAAWEMANVAVKHLSMIDTGIVLTKYGHVLEEIPGIVCLEAGHPVPDENSFKGTKQILSMVENLTEEDTVLFLVSGGGSALFELPLISSKELFSLTDRLLACGASITEINTIRKRLSTVKGGRFAKLCEPASVYSIIISDVLGDRLDMIASGPAAIDASTTEEALSVLKKYDIMLSDKALSSIIEETPKQLSNVTSVIVGNNQTLLKTADQTCKALGYQTIVISDPLICEAKEAATLLCNMIKKQKEKTAVIAGGETIVNLLNTDSPGMGGRNQELAFTAARELSDCAGTALFSVGSDGTDGPTDAAGGYADSDSFRELKEKNINYEDVLFHHDSYHALKEIGNLLITGPTGTNVNDLMVALFDPTIS